jgi:hypothetical protein
VVLVTPGFSAPDDPYTGIWMLNVARSGGEARTQRLTVEITGDQESQRPKLVWPNGRRQVTSYVAEYDEKETDGGHGESRRTGEYAERHHRVVSPSLKDS